MNDGTPIDRRPGERPVLRRIPVILLCLWTLFVWIGRVRNLAQDDSLGFAGKLTRGSLALSFLALVVVVVAFGLAKRPRSAAVAVALLGVWGTAVWTVRGVGISLADHSVAFKVVHAVLALVSIGLSVWAVTTVRQNLTPTPVSPGR